jgi:hypothetical protein
LQFVHRSALMKLHVEEEEEEEDQQKREDGEEAAGWR